MFEFVLDHKHIVVFRITPNSFMTKFLESVLLHPLCFMDRFLLGWSPLFSCYGSGCSDLICHCCGDTCCSTSAFHGNLYAVAFITHQSLFLVNKHIALFAYFSFVNLQVHSSVIVIFICILLILHATYLSHTFNITLG